jgi:hypothetical protein
MSSATTFVLLVAPDPSAPHLFRAWCPDLPGWYATGETQQEAADAGSEIVRALITERRSAGSDVEPVLRAVPVPVDTASRRASTSRAEERDEKADRGDGDETQVPGVQWMRMPIEAGSRQRSSRPDGVEEDDGRKRYAVREARLSDEVSLTVQDPFEF